MILVTGAAGKSGLAVLNALAAAGAETRAFVRQEEYRAQVEAAGATEVIVGDLEKPGDVDRALQEAKALYLILPNMHPHEEALGKRILRQAVSAGLPRVVYHSVLYPQIKAMAHHWQKLHVEESLIASGLDFTILQPAAYMQNILGYWDAITKAGHYQLPYSVDALSTPVDLDDIALVAAKALTEDGHDHATYELCGPQQLSARDQASIIGKHLNKQVSAQAISVDEWREQALGLPAYAQDTLASMFDYYDQHGFIGNSKVLEMLLGRPPTNFAQFLKRLN